jgi:hypothetical protein
MPRTEQEQRQYEAAYERWFEEVRRAADPLHQHPVPAPAIPGENDHDEEAG